MPTLWAQLRLADNGPNTRKSFRGGGSFSAFYRVHIATGGRMNRDDVALKFGGAKSRTRVGFFKIRDIPRKASRALLRGDRRRDFVRRFRLNGTKLLESMSQGPKKRWMRDILDPAVEIPEADFDKFTMNWSDVWPYIRDRRTKALVPDEQTILDWCPEAGVFPHYPDAWDVDDPRIPPDPTEAT